MLAAAVLGLFAAGQAAGPRPPAHVPPAVPQAAVPADPGRYEMPEAFRHQSERRVNEYLPRLRALVRTEDPALDALVERIYAQCVTGKLFDPMPPELPHRWFAPGGSYYLGQWLWDTMFVLLAFAPLDDDALVREVFENYWHAIEENPDAPRGSARYGMVPNFLGARELRAGRGWPPVAYSQIPILGWGVLGVYRQTHDRALIERALPLLVAFDEWYSHERDTDGDRLIEYGAYEAVEGNDLLQTARFETFDFHLPLDSMRMTRHPRRAGGGAWYGNVEGVEQTSFLLMTERAIAELARELGQLGIARRFEQTVERRSAALQRKMWDPQSEFFFSLDRDSDRPIRVRTIQGFLPLAAGAATSAQAAVARPAAPRPETLVDAVPGAHRRAGRAALRPSRLLARRHVAGDDVPGGVRLAALRPARAGFRADRAAARAGRGARDLRALRQPHRRAARRARAGDVVDRVERDRRERVRCAGRLPDDPRPRRGCRPPPEARQAGGPLPERHRSRGSDRLRARAARRVRPRAGGPGARPVRRPGAARARRRRRARVRRTRGRDLPCRAAAPSLD